MPPRWKDTSSFSQSDTVRRPHSWTYETRRLRLTVYTARQPAYPPNTFMFNAYGSLHFEEVPLEAKDAKAAQAEAAACVRAHLRQMLKELEGA